MLSSLWWSENVHLNKIIVQSHRWTGMYGRIFAQLHSLYNFIIALCFEIFV